MRAHECAHHKQCVGERVNDQLSEVRGSWLGGMLRRDPWVRVQLAGRKGLSSSVPFQGTREASVRVPKMRDAVHFANKADMHRNIYQNADVHGVVLILIV